MGEGLHLRLLGGFRVERDGEPIPESAWERPTARALVKLLAVQPSHRLHREQVMEALWPELAPESAVQSFRNALSRARKGLEPDARRGEYRVLRLIGELVELEPECVWVDVDDYVQLASDALASGAVDALGRAVAAYTGELLPEDRFEDWAAARRDELASLHVRVSVGLVDALEAGGRYSEAIARAEETLREDGTQEEIHRRLMRLHLLTGSRHRALQQYQACRAVLERELGVEPEEETEALHKEILTLGPSSSPTTSVFPLPAAIVRATDAPFVGRATALDLLGNSLEQVQKGTGSVVLVSGEPGVGKTRLVAEIGAQAASSGVRVLWGGGYRAEGGVPYAPFMEALEGVVGSLPQERRASLAERYPEIAQILPSLETRSAESSAPAGDSPQFFASVARLLSELAEEHPLLLVLDDLHAVDPASVQLFDHLMRVVNRHPWLILGTFRMEDVEEAGGFAELWTTAVRQGRCRRVGLMRLSAAEATTLVGALLEAPVHEDLVRHVVERSLGNPLFVGELLRALRDSGMIVVREGCWVLQSGEETAVPHGIRDLIGQRVARMEDATRRVLQVAAVAGGDVPFGMLLGASGLTEGLLLDALDQALAVRLLLEHGEGYAFAHPLFQEALYGALSAGRRVHLHGTLAAVLEERMPDEVEALAYHHRRAGNEEQAIVYVERAGARAASVYAYGLAESRYREVIGWLEARKQMLDAVRVRRKLADVLAILPRMESALDVLRPALAVCRETGEMEQLVAVAGQMGTMLRGLGRFGEGFDLLEPLLSDVERLDAGEGPALYYLALAQLHRAQDHQESALRFATRAAETARAIGDERLLARAEIILSLTMLMLWEKGASSGEEATDVDLSGWRSYMEHAAAIFTRLDDTRGILLTHANLAVYSVWWGEFARAEAYYQELFQLSTRIGNLGQESYHAANVGWAQTLRGDTECGLASLRHAQKMMRDLERTWVSVYPSLHLAAALLRCGDWTGAAAALNEAQGHADATSDLSNRQFIAGFRAWSELEQRRPDSGLRILQEFIEGNPQTEETAEELGAVLAWAYAETGDTQHAMRIIELMAARYTRSGENKTLAEVLVVYGRVLLLQGAADEAHAVLMRACGLAVGMPYPYIEVQSLYLGGIAPGISQELAVSLLEEAREIALRIGARAYLARIDPALTAVQDRAAAQP